MFSFYLKCLYIFKCLWNRVDFFSPLAVFVVIDSWGYDFRGSSEFSVAELINAIKEVCIINVLCLYEI